MADNKNQFKCSGNCLNCLPAQRTYCASQHAYSNMMVLDEVMKTLNELKTDIGELSAQVEAMQNSDSAVYEIAHEDGGADSKPSKENV